MEPEEWTLIYQALGILTLSTGLMVSLTKLLSCIRRRIREKAIAEHEHRAKVEGLCNDLKKHQEECAQDKEALKKGIQSDFRSVHERLDELFLALFPTRK